MIVVLIGPSGSGKTEFSKECIRQGLDRVITNTTRARREGDRIDEYHFLTREEFVNKINSNKLVEYAEYNGNLYGVGIEDLTKNCVVVVEPKGYANIKKIYGNKVYSVYLEVSEMERARRAKERGDSIKSISERIIEDRALFKEDLKHEVDMVLTDIKLESIPSIVKKGIKVWKE